MSSQANSTDLDWDGPAVLVDVTTISELFPPSPHPEVFREGVINTILQTLEGDSELVIVEGEENTGKTVLLSQLARREADRCVCLFLRPLSSLATDLTYIRTDVAKQISFLAFDSIDKSENIDEAGYRTLINSLSALINKKFGSSSRDILFVVDGLDAFTEADAHIRDEIVSSLLPFGRKGFKFVVSGGVSNLPERWLSQGKPKIFQSQLFSPHETAELFKDFNLSAENLMAIHASCRGDPSHLSSYARELGTGQSVTDLVENPPQSLSGLINREWHKVVASGIDYELVLAVVAFAQTVYSVQDLAAITKIDLTTISQYISSQTILNIHRESGFVTYVSTAHQRFARTKLVRHQTKALGLLIDYLQDLNLHGSRSGELLNYYQTTGRNQDIVQALDSSALSQVLEQAQSFQPLLALSNLGLVASNALNDYSQFTRLAIQRSLVLEYEAQDDWDVEIEAYLALADFEAAMALAQNTKIKEDRLAILAKLARQLKVVKHIQFEAIQEEVLSLYREIIEGDLNISTGRLQSLAVDLLWIKPELARNLVNKYEQRYFKVEEKLFGGGSDEKAAAHSQRVFSLTQNVDGIADRRTILDTNEFETFQRASAEFFKAETVAEISAAIDDLEGENRIFFLLGWLDVYKNQDLRLYVAELCLDSIIKTTDYLLTARDARIISSVLAKFEPSEAPRYEELIDRINSLRTLIRDRSASVEMVRLELNLIDCEITLGRVSDAITRLNSLFNDVRQQGDQGTKACCLAWLVTRGDKIYERLKSRAPNVLAERQQIISELDEAVFNILTGTAEQFEILEDTISTLSQYGSPAALTYAELINTSLRRDAAFLHIATHHIQTSAKTEIDLRYVFEALGKISQPIYWDQAITTVVRRLSHKRFLVTSNHIEQIKHQIGRIGKIESADLRCQVYIFLAELTTEVDESLAVGFLRKGEASWKQIVLPEVQAYTGFNAAIELARRLPEASRNFLNRAVEINSDADVARGGLQRVSRILVTLLIRVFGGLVYRKVASRTDLSQVESIITSLSTPFEQIEHWSRLALTCERYGDKERIVYICNEHIIPLIQILPKDDPFIYTSTVIQALPAVYIANQTVARRFLTSLNQQARNEAIASICDYIHRRLLGDEPSKGKIADGRELSYSDAIDICSLLELADQDHLISGYCRSLCSALNTKASKTKVTRDQRADIGQEMLKLAKTKLPDKKNIEHEGYILLVKAYAASLQNWDIHQWERLSNDIANVPNVSDRAFLYAEFSDVMPPNLDKMRLLLAKKALEETRHITSTLDKIHRYEALATVTIEFNSALAREVLQEAVSSIASFNRNGVKVSSQSILDLAYNLRPELADTLAKQLDDDPARKDSIKNAASHITLLKKRDETAKQKEPLPEFEISDQEVVSISHMNLASLNAGMYTSYNPKKIKPFIARCAELQITESGEILDYVVQNAIFDHHTKDEYIRSIFQTFISTFKLARMLSDVKNFRKIEMTEKSGHIISLTNQLISAPGKRLEVESFWREWIRSNVRDYIKIVDPYFCIDDLAIIKLILSEKPECRVIVLTSHKQQLKQRVEQPYSEAYGKHWRTRIADSPPPKTDIYIIGTEKGHDTPIHDRWWLTEGAGLRLGTSANAMGYSKISEISTIPSAEANALESSVDAYLYRMVREYNGERLLLNSFTLQ